MNLFNITCSGADTNRRVRSASHRSVPAHSRPIKHTSEPKPTKVLPPPHRVKQRRQTRQRRLRCDCGQLAVTVIKVLVGSDPQYTIHLPLCPDCLNLERELHGYKSD